jgi:formylglycine-generating enzyme required for sulfatase activity
LSAQLGTCLGGSPGSFAGSDDALPVNCVHWAEAFAFCIWVGGRLPTEAEWNYAAAAGAQQRYYPWSIPPFSTEIDPSRANYGTAAVTRVGSMPDGGGLYGQLDLGGNVAEWVLDWYQSPYPPCGAADCATIATDASVPFRVSRGGVFSQGPTNLTTFSRQFIDPGTRSVARGVRCARDP